MSDHIDHAAEARKHISWMEELLGAGEGSSDAVLLATGQLAQAHATLALAEQARIANLLALAQGTDGALSTVARDLAYIRLGDSGLAPDIAAALGIETGAGDE